jgi:hypothetical protein
MCFYNLKCLTLYFLFFFNKELREKAKECVQKKYSPCQQPFDKEIRVKCGLSLMESHLCLAKFIINNPIVDVLLLIPYILTIIFVLVLFILII